MRRPFIIIAVVNLLYVTLFAIVFSLLPRVHPQPVSEIRSRLQSAPTFEELQRRASAAGATIEAADRTIIDLNQVATHSVILGITCAVLNTALVWLLFRWSTLKV
jgi:hypothetical protein